MSVEDGDVSTCSEITLPDGNGGELSGEYTPVAIIDFNATTTYAAIDVLAQSLDVSFDSGLGATSLWVYHKLQEHTLDTTSERRCNQQ